ncbi:type VII secretion integral membrane protein EccD [Micromonospora rosaria]|uniref:type VII secretion integral membrane protein EccD n=1 Tax=Micromonospora rosaria TaxID=47874 RepID=UPI00147089D7|nr:type VII secretion integral membrane protein EccD [Micromonospora rosaria]
MAEYSRVTVVGDHRRADVVLPSDELVGVLLPDVLELLGEPPAVAPHPRLLVTSTGHALPATATLATAGVPDGAVLRLVAAADSPPAPVVHDVAEQIIDASERLTWRWSPVSRRWTVTLAVVTLSVLAGALAYEIRPGRPGVVLLTAAATIASLLGAALARVREPAGTALILVGGALALDAGWAGASIAGFTTMQRLLLLAAEAGTLVALLGVATPLGAGGRIGGALGLALVGLWWVGEVAGLPAERLAALMAVVAVVLLGFLPRLALLMAGLPRLDDARAAGREVTRPDVDSAIAAAHRGLALAVAALAMSLATSGWLLAGHGGRWTLGLACLLTAIALSRARMYPLAGEMLALFAAAAVTLAALLLAWLRFSGGASGAALVTVAAAATACMLFLAGEPTDHVRVRIRRGVDRIEAAAVLATVPVAVGVFGTYDRLVHIF